MGWLTLIFKVKFNFKVKLWSMKSRAKTVLKQSLHYITITEYRLYHKPNLVCMGGCSLAESMHRDCQITHCIQPISLRWYMNTLWMISFQVSTVVNTPQICRYSPSIWPSIRQRSRRHLENGLRRKPLDIGISIDARLNWGRLNTLLDWISRIVHYLLSTRTK